jgi:hypothetical protein
MKTAQRLGSGPDRRAMAFENLVQMEAEPSFSGLFGTQSSCRRTPEAAYQRRAMSQLSVEKTPGASSEADVCMMS